MNIFHLREIRYTGNNPDSEVRTLKQIIYTKKLLKKYLPFVNLDKKLIRELNANSQAYSKNFQLLLENKGNIKLLEIEKGLNQNDIRIRKLLNIYN